MHLYVHNNFVPLNAMLEEEMSKYSRQPRNNEPNGTFVSNYWLVNVQKGVNKTTIYTNALNDTSFNTTEQFNTTELYKKTLYT